MSNISKKTIRIYSFLIFPLFYGEMLVSTHFHVEPKKVFKWYFLVYI